MSAELIAGSIAAAPTAKWFADRVFGPSAGAVGEQLKIYLRSRLPTIFGVAEVKARERKIQPESVPPGLLARMIMDASFSSDEPTITDWWANLFVDASVEASNQHAVFSDIMATVGPREAHCLVEFINEFTRFNPNLTLHAMEGFSAQTDSLLDVLSKAWIGSSPQEGESFRKAYLNLTGGGSPWPIRPVSWSVPVKQDTGEVKMVTQVNSWFVTNQVSIRILERSRVLEFATSNLSLWGRNGWVRAIMLTSLGRDFYAACTGDVEHGG